MLYQKRVVFNEGHAKTQHLIDYTFYFNESVYALNPFFRAGFFQFQSID
jgi:hypothetical protein